MTFELWQLFALGLGYLTLLFAIAWTAERGAIPESLIRHPAIYTLSLGVFAGAWALFGAIGLADSLGYGFLAYYFGAACMFMFAPLMITPLARICRIYQLASLADLLAFRFRSRWVGMAVTLCLILAMLPMLAMQVQSVSDTIHLLSQEGSDTSHAGRDTLSAMFCITIALFTLLFGSRQLSGTERHNGLVIAIAVESLFKITALYAIAAIAIDQVFGGWEALNTWLQQHPGRIAQLRSPLHENTSRTLMLMFVASAIVMPHMFHMVFAENPTSRSLANIAWSAPLLLLAMSLPVLPILWAGHAVGSSLSPEYFTIGIGLSLESPLLGVLAFIGGLSAASGAIIVITLALATMTLNHLILPFYRLRGEPDLYRRVLWTRRILIITILMAAYIFSTAVRDNSQLSSLGMLAFIATLQFVPGVLAILYWPRANRHGFLAGLVCGYAFWYFSLLLPFVSGDASSGTPATLTDIMQTLFSDSSQWNAAAMGSLGINIVAFIITSLLTRTSAEEKTAAAMCSSDQLNRPARLALGLHAPADFQLRLGKALGEKTAGREIQRALAQLGFTDDERRPYALRRLRDQLEANLSGLLGPATAHRLVNELLPYEPVLRDHNDSDQEDIQFIEQRLEQHQNDLTGLAAELDTLRRHHRHTLQELPIGLMTLGSDGEILMWNTAMESLTGISSQSVVGSHIRTLQEPWQSLLIHFLEATPSSSLRQECVVNNDTRCMVLHKTADDSQHGTRVVVVEDITETDRLTQELMHSERLASIGRLAAGVAHEIGNPVTGIACLAQNLREDEPASNAVSQATRDILTQTQRITRIVQSLVHFAHSGRSQQPSPDEPVHLQHCVHEAIELLKLNKSARPIDWHNDCDTRIVLKGDAQQLQQVFINLLSNARDASPDHGRITISAFAEGPRAIIRVADEGSGIDPAIQEQVFEPFFTTKEAGKGTGLGLSLVYRIVETHHGQIRIESPLAGGKGTAFIISLPTA